MVASMPVVSSIETRSTQSKVSPTGSPSRISPTRWRISGSSRREVPRRGDGLDALAVRLVPRAVHGDEAGRQREVRLGVDDHDGGRGGEQLRVLLDVDDVVELRHRPVGAELALGAVVHRVLLAEAFEVSPERVRLEELGVRDVDLVEGDRVGVGSGLALRRGGLRGGFAHGVSRTGGRPGQPIASRGAARTRAPRRPSMPWPTSLERMAAVGETEPGSEVLWPWRPTVTGPCPVPRGAEHGVHNLGADGFSRAPKCVGGAPRCF